MVQVVFLFDTEDYTSPVSDDAILRLAELLRGEGIRGSFNIVGELARVLEERGREDIVAALRHHEVNYHTYRHSWHPTIAEYSDDPVWERPLARYLAEESEGSAIVRRVFGVDALPAYVPPGNNISAQSLHGAAKLGIPVVAGSLFKETGGKAIWYCNTLNLECNEYLDDLLLRDGIGEAVGRFPMWRAWERLVFCCHPNLIPYAQFWDAVNMKGGNRVPWGEWKYADRRPEADVERFYDDLRTLIRRLQAESDFTFATCRDIWEQENGAAERSLDRGALMVLLGGLEERFGFGVSGSDSYSLADLFQAAVRALNGDAGPYRAGAPIGPIQEPEGIASPLAIEARQLRLAAARLVDAEIVPHRIPLGESDGGPGPAIGPGDFLRAAVQVLAGADSARIAPGPQLPDTSGFYRFDDFRLAGTWIYSDDFKDEWVTRRLRWQSWTIRGA
ncbi:hypothetical protein [Cohnella sp. REN36]|uniref:hypothetical protein n=1 Tax=Cohnella sp. REN36 TaxID=2887347 RepID=UPI001D154246|nr:hypothetical protein [Cohnella sp. REN36]MCC3376047.1 hypothetical protein [Cohnella sp. REN36]